MRALLGVVYFCLAVSFSATARASIPVVEIEIPAPHPNGEAANFDPGYYTGADWPEGYIALTFDDGPSPLYTSRVLNILKRYGVRATFFLTGEMSKYRPLLVQREAREGHTIATHTYIHPHLNHLSVEKGLEEIHRGIKAITEALGHAPAPFFRFPFLESNEQIRQAVAKEGLTAVGWAQVQLVTNLAPENGHLKRGILIGHDLRATILSYLPPFLEKMQKYGYTAVVLVPQKPDIDP